MLKSDAYNTVKEPAQGYFRDRGSKFISLIYPVKGEDDVKEILQTLKTF